MGNDQSQPKRNAPVPRNPQPRSYSTRAPEVAQQSQYAITSFNQSSSPSVALTQVTRGVEVQANHINAWLVLDASGSMAGEPWNRVLSGVGTLLQELTASDFVGIMTFNSNVQIIDMDMKARLNLSKLRTMSPSGSTKLYDAIIEAGTAACALHLKMSQELSANVITYMIVLTDGDDTGSTGTLAQCMEVLQMFNRFRNFKLILAGVNLSANASTIMRRMAAVGDDDFEYRALRSNADITNLFQHISVNLVARVRTVIV